MTAFQAALDALASLSVAGVAHHYGVDAVPERLTRAQLPALLVLPGELHDRRLFKERGSAFEAITFGGTGLATLTVTDLLLTAPRAAGLGMRSHLPGLIGLIDAYLAALRADVTLGGTLAQPAQVAVEPGIFTHGGRAYHGCALRHTWALAIAPPVSEG
jgi:hypothetical protein